MPKITGSFKQKPEVKKPTSKPTTPEAKKPPRDEWWKRPLTEGPPGGWSS